MFPQLNYLKSPRKRRFKSYPNRAIEKETLEKSSQEDNKK